MPVVSPEFGVGAFERRVSVGLGLLDTARNLPLVMTPAYAAKSYRLVV